MRSIWWVCGASWMLRLGEPSILSPNKYFMSIAGCGQGAGRQESKGQPPTGTPCSWEESELALKSIGCREPPDGVREAAVSEGDLGVQRSPLGERQAQGEQCGR